MTHVTHVNKQHTLYCEYTWNMAYFVLWTMWKTAYYVLWIHVKYGIQCTVNLCEKWHTLYCNSMQMQNMGRFIKNASEMAFPVKTSCKVDNCYLSNHYSWTHSLSTWASVWCDLSVGGHWQRQLATHECARPRQMTQGLVARHLSGTLTQADTLHRGGPSPPHSSAPPLHRAGRSETHNTHWLTHLLHLHIEQADLKHTTLTDSLICSTST